jgi:hypothetical protein
MTIMSNTALSPDRQGFHAGTTSVADAVRVPATPGNAAGQDTFRPFRVDVPEADLVDLRRRISATRWPDRETVTDQSQGPRLRLPDGVAPAGALRRCRFSRRYRRLLPRS